MAFDPDKYLQSKTKEGFNPDAYIASKTAIKPSEGDQPSELQSLIEGAATGLTGSLKPILAGGSQALMETLTGVSEPSNILERYRALRDKEKASQESLEKTNPASFMAGEVIGSLPLAAAMPAGQGIKGAAALGAGLGALTGGAESKGDLTKGEITPVLSDVLKGAALGGATGGLAEGLLSKLAGSKPLADQLEEFAAKRALSATGGTAGERKELLKKDRILEHGKNLLEKTEFADKPLVTPFSKPEVILERAQNLKEKSGKAIGDILKSLDNKFTSSSPQIQDSFFNPIKLVDKLKEMQQRFTKNGVIQRSTESQYNELDKLIDDISQYGNNPIPFNQADEIKQLVTNLSYDDKGKMTNNLMAEVRGFINDEIEKSADKVAQLSSDSALYNQYIKAKDVYRTAKDTERMSLGQAARNLGNKDLGITDYIAGGAMAAIHGTPAGIATAGLTKLAKTYGNSIAASGAKKTADVLRGVNKAFTTNGDALKSIGSRLTTSQDPIESSLGKILTEASQKDNIGRNAIIFSLMQNSKYRELMKNLVNEEE